MIMIIIVIIIIITNFDFDHRDHIDVYDDPYCHHNADNHLPYLDQCSPDLGHPHCHRYHCDHRDHRYDPHLSWNTLSKDLLQAQHLSQCQCQYWYHLEVANKITINFIPKNHHHHLIRQGRKNQHRDHLEQQNHLSSTVLTGQRGRMCHQLVKRLPGKFLHKIFFFSF